MRYMMKINDHCGGRKPYKNPQDPLEIRTLQGFMIFLLFHMLGRPMNTSLIGHEDPGTLLKWRTLGRRDIMN